MEISIILDGKVIKTKKHIQNLPASQILEDEDGELYIILELWGMYQNWLLVKANNDLIDKWKMLPVKDQGEFFGSVNEKWLLLFKDGDEFRSIEKIPLNIIDYLNSHRLYPISMN